MHTPAYIFFALVVDSIVRQGHARQIPIPERFLSCDQIDFTGNGFADEIVIRAEVCILDHLANDVAFAGDGSDHFRLTLRGPLTTFAAMLVALFSAKVNLIDL